MTETKKYEDGVQEGYLLGYQKGIGDGRSQGYSDARYRAHRAVDAVSRLSAVDRNAVKKALVQLVGPES